jgi:hypothetical protein
MASKSLEIINKHKDLADRHRYLAQNTSAVNASKHNSSASYHDWLAKMIEKHGYSKYKKLSSEVLNENCGEGDPEIQPKDLPKKKTGKPLRKIVESEKRSETADARETFMKNVQEKKKLKQKEEEQKNKISEEKDAALERAGVSGFNKPKRTPNHPSKSHVVVTKVNGKPKTIRFGQQGVSGSPKKEGESESYKNRRKSFKARHSKNIAKGKSSAAYWANKVKW